MKKFILIILAVMVMTGSLSACSNNTESNTGEKKLKIVTTIFPEYDWVKTILGEKADEVEFSLLLDNGVDIHSYQPSINDILKISSCDLFIYVGGESDKWVDDALAQATNKNMAVINLLDVLGDKVKSEEIVEGMEHEHDEEHEHNEDEEHDHEHEIELDEHVWLSLNNTKIICDKITECLKKLDSSNADIYQSNADTYMEKLSSLDTQYKTVVNESAVKTLLFGDRFPFRYMTDDYNLKYYAAFTGCSAETEASFETVIFLSGKIDELNLKSILTIESSDKRIAETIKNNTNSKDQKILTLNSMQGITSKDIRNGITYLSIMTDNLNVLKEALK